MSQDKIADLLERAAARVPDTNPPMEELLRDGENVLARRCGAASNSGRLLECLRHGSKPQPSI